MDRLKRKTFKFHWLWVALPLSVLVMFVVFWATAPRTDGSFTLLSISNLLIFGIFIGIAVHFRKYTVVLTADKIRVKRVLWSKSIQYTEIDTIDLSNPIYVMQIHRSNEVWPAFTVLYGLKGWKELMAELVERAPDDVEVIDPMNRLGWTRLDGDAAE